MSFTDELWDSIRPLFGSILEHPFVAGLTDGTLPTDRFQFYAIQDAIYLRDFARALALAAARAPHDTWCELFCEHARGALVVERALHESFFREWNLSLEQLEDCEPAPTNLAYGCYLLRTGYTAPFEEALSALLPCYWIYWEVGKVLEHRGSPNPLYQRWIGTYASEDFGEAVRQALSVFETAAAGLPEPRKAPMRRHFLTASRYEWMFWDAAWRMEGWPI